MSEVNMLEAGPFTCRFCGKTWEIAMRLAQQHERFCGGRDRLEVTSTKGDEDGE